MTTLMLWLAGLAYAAVALWLFGFLLGACRRPGFQRVAECVIAALLAALWPVAMLIGAGLTAAEDDRSRS
ncbi:MAG TPA: hypothetical protein VFS11_10240 [Gemmatimonadales bacterium]|nr:hypothetical protein [Gemmatimonadales bacterium]